jgi:hypothetical protein
MAGNDDHTTARASVEVSVPVHLDQRQIRQATVTDEELTADAAIYGVPACALDGTAPPSSP